VPLPRRMSSGLDIRIYEWYGQFVIKWRLAPPAFKEWIINAGQVRVVGLVLVEVNGPEDEK